MRMWSYDGMYQDRTKEIEQYYMCKYAFGVPCKWLYACDKGMYCIFKNYFEEGKEIARMVDEART